MGIVNDLLEANNKTRIESEGVLVARYEAIDSCQPNCFYVESNMLEYGANI